MPADATMNLTLQMDVIPMSEQEYIVGKCSRCGEELRVPSRLEQFSCMFCGAKLTAEDLLDEMPPLVEEGDVDALMEQVKKGMVRCVIDHRGIQKKIVRSEFDDAFASYEAACRTTIENLDLACRLAPSQASSLLEQAVTSFLDLLEQDWMQNKTKQSALLSDDKMIVAIFMVPMIDHLNLKISKELCQVLQTNWVARNPKNPFFVGTYDEISGGFRKKFKLCFITTAVCEELGKPDDCEELTAFRAFRDGYLRTCEDGEALIREYYDIAPGIVTCINICGDRAARYEEIRTRYLAPCYEEIQAGALAECKTRYTRMVRELEKQYLN